MTTTRLNDLFDGMEKEEGNVLDDKIKVEEDEAVKEISELYESFDYLLNPFDKNSIHGLYLKFNGKVGEFTSEEINKFFAHQQIKTEKKDILLNLTYSTKLGIFLSSLVNNSKDEEITLDILRKELSFSEIGYELKDKKLNLIGVESFPIPKRVLSGEYNITGSVITTPEITQCKINITGDARCAGLGLRSGQIYIKGNVETAGQRMGGGKLIIDGNVTERIGYFSKGGQIHVNGEIPDISNFRFVGADVFHNGKMIYTNEKPISKLAQPIYTLAHKAKELLKE